MLEISAFYLVKQKSFIPKKYDLGRSQYQNKKALFTDPIFSDGFAWCIFLVVHPGLEAYISHINVPFSILCTYLYTLSTKLDSRSVLL